MCISYNDSRIHASNAHDIVVLPPRKLGTPEVGCLICEDRADEIC
jgi:hypothetical protein